MSYKSNEKKSDLKKVLNKFIEDGIVTLIKWDYPKRLKSSGISGQTTQQNHSIWTFRNSKYIGLFDIDEYINMKKERNIHNFFNKFVKNNNINIKNIGGFDLCNKFFYNPYNLSTKNFDFLKIYNCDKTSVSGCRGKVFVIPKNTNMFGIHNIFNGKEQYYIPNNEIYFNHYYFLNKSNRGKKKTNIIDNSIQKHIDENIKL